MSHHMIDALLYHRANLDRALAGLLILYGTEAWAQLKLAEWKPAALDVREFASHCDEFYASGDFMAACCAWFWNKRRGMADYIKYSYAYDSLVPATPEPPDPLEYLLREERAVEATIRLIRHFEEEIADYIEYNETRVYANRQK